MKNIVDMFIQAEHELDLFELRLCGFKIWPWIRVEIFRNLNAEIFHQNIVPAYVRQNFSKSNGDIEDEGKYLDSLKKIYSNVEIIISTNAKRAILDSDSLCCPTTGIVKNIFGSRSAYMMHAYDEEKNTIKFLDGVLDFKRIVQKEFLAVSNNDISECVCNLNKLLSSYYNKFLSERFNNRTYKTIEYVLNQKGYQYFFENLFRDIGTKLIVVNSYYSTINMCVIEAAKKNGIKTLEMQHGLIGRYHMAYHFFRDANPSEEMWKPDYFFAYGEYDIQTIRNYIDKNNMFAVGNYRLAKLKCIESSDRIMIIGDISENGCLVEFAIKIKELLGDKKIVYRFHPEANAMLVHKDILKENRIEISDDPSVSIYNYLSNAEVVIGLNSTALFEASYLGKKVFVYGDDDNKSWFRDVFPEITQHNFKSLLYDDCSNEANKSFYSDFNESFFRETLNRLLGDKK